MDRRGFTTDPNRSVVAQSEWWEDLGPTQRPSPYEYASWKYLQDFKTEIVETIAVPQVVYDNGTDFTIPLYTTVWDGGLFNPVIAPEVILDGGGFTSSGQIVVFEKTIFATVYVYDSYASAPTLQSINSIVLDEGGISTDPNVDPISTEGGLTFASEKPAQTQDDTPPGTLLGQLDYTLKEKRVDIIGWSHYNWEDATPVRQAFKAMVNSLPQCAEGVYVRNDPTAFWTSLGFRFENKGDVELKFFPVRYRGY